MIPDDEPWWKVRETAAAIGDGYVADQVCHRTRPLAAERDDREGTLRALDALPFRPFTAEW